MRHIFLLAAALVLPAPSMAQVAAASSATVPAMTAADTQLAAFFDVYDKAQLARSPQGQSYRGIKTDQDKWNDESDAAATKP